jgi:hypothetical protein
MMFKRVLFVIAIVAVLLGPSAALAQGPISPNHSDPSWQASYWNNVTLSGSPVLQRDETDLNYNWGYGSPDSTVVVDNFSARWTRYLYMEQAGTYRFTVTSDDGVRVFVDDVKIIDGWWDHAAQTFTADRTLSAGHHLARVEFYERGGVAVCQFSWTSVIPITNWRGEYYNNKALSGSPVLVRDDANINFNWGTASPAPGVVNPDQFSVRWTRNVSLGAGSYRFAMTIDDGGRLWVNNHLLIDQWSDHGRTTFYGSIYLSGGSVPIKMEFYENLGVAEAWLSWSTEPGHGEVIVDDKDAGFVKGGSSSGWHIAYEGNAGRLYWTKNNDYVRPNYNWARWYPSLTAGKYEVFVYIPERYTTTAKARYWVSHRDGLTLRVVSQSANGNKWVSLGTYWFRGTRADYVSLADVTYEPYLSRLIAFDAVKWVPR